MYLKMLRFFVIVLFRVTQIKLKNTLIIESKK